MNSRICTAAEAMADVHDGAVVAAHVWGGCGTPGYLFRALAARRVKGLQAHHAKSRQEVFANFAKEIVAFAAGAGTLEGMQE